MGHRTQPVTPATAPSSPQKESTSRLRAFFMQWIPFFRPQVVPLSEDNVEENYPSFDFEAEAKADAVLLAEYEWKEILPETSPQRFEGELELYDAKADATLFPETWKTWRAVDKWKTFIPQKPMETKKQGFFSGLLAFFMGLLSCFKSIPEPQQNPIIIDDKELQQTTQPKESAEDGDEKSQRTITTLPTEKRDTRTPRDKWETQRQTLHDICGEAVSLDELSSLAEASLTPDGIESFLSDYKATLLAKYPMIPTQSLGHVLHEMGGCLQQERLKRRATPQARLIVSAASPAKTPSSRQSPNSNPENPEYDIRYDETILDNIERFTKMDDVYQAWLKGGKVGKEPPMPVAKLQKRPAPAGAPPAAEPAATAARSPCC